MFRLGAGLVCMLGVCLTVSLAQDKKGDDKKDPFPLQKKVGSDPRPKSVAQPVTPGECEIFFVNGSKVRMNVQSESLEIATLYGKLAVPVKDVRAIEFGLHYPAGVEAKITQAIKDLGSGDYRERGRADKTLSGMGPIAYPAILEASRGKEPEVANRAKEIAKKMQEKFPKKDLKTMVEDRVMTRSFTIVGRILTSTIKSKSEYFGEVDLSLAKMRSLRALGLTSADVDVTIDAAKYANAGQWLDTGFTVDGRTRISVVAKGMINIWPQGGGGYMSNPNGYTATQNGFGGGGRAFNMTGQKVGGGVNPQIHAGMLLGKIGTDGEIFVVGENFDDLPETEGNLYLHIGPSRWNSTSAGTYDVKIRAKND
ncbi:MAG: hypothetical protein HYX68_00955 [Planctomycetes bacterium]|nr:hypothetical protein [Planctomycetota bacterium]